MGLSILFVDLLMLFWDMGISLCKWALEIGYCSLQYMCFSLLFH